MAEYSQTEQASAVAAGVDWLEASTPEIRLMSRFMDDHGDPSEWSQATADLYEAEHARLMGGAL